MITSILPNLKTTYHESPIPTMPLSMHSLRGKKLVHVSCLKALRKKIPNSSMFRKRKGIWKKTNSWDISFDRKIREDRVLDDLDRLFQTTVEIRICFIV